MKSKLFALLLSMGSLSGFAAYWTGEHDHEWAISGDLTEEEYIPTSSGLYNYASGTCLMDLISSSDMTRISYIIDEAGRFTYVNGGNGSKYGSTYTALFSDAVNSSIPFFFGDMFAICSIGETAGTHTWVYANWD